MTEMIYLWNSLSIRQRVLSLTTVICLFVYGIIHTISGQMIAGLPDQQAAARWDETGQAAQVSAFFVGGTAVDEMQIKNFEAQLNVALQAAAVTNEDTGSRLYIDAYSSQGNITVTSEQASLDAKAVGIGGDFFLFHPVKLLNGSYFSGNDLMKDFILLDEEAAWRLFGSNDIAGMSVTIGGIPHYVAGVYEREGGRIEEAAGFNETILFVSHESLTAYGLSGGISTYELVAPNPVDNFVYNTVKEKFGLKENQMLVIENSERFSLKSMIPVVMDYGLRSMQSREVSYPYWENIARGYEDIRAVYLIFEFIFLIIPLVIIFVILFKNGRKVMKKVGTFIKNRISFFSLVLFFATVLAGCGNKEVSTMAETNSKNYVYRVDELDFKKEDSEQSSFSFLKGKDKIYAYNYNWGNGLDDQQFIEILALNEDGTIRGEGKIPVDSNGGLNSITPDGKGNFYAVRCVYMTEPDENGMYLEQYYLVKFSEQGEELFSIYINDMPQLESILPDSYFYVGDILCANDSIYVNVVGNYVQFDENGSFLKILESDDENGLDGASFYLLESGKVATLIYEETGYYAAYIDLETGKIDNKAKLPGTSYEYSVYPGMGYDLYLVNSYGVYGYNIGEEDKTQLMSYIDSDMGIYSVFNVVPINETTFYATYDDMETGQISMGKFTKVPPAEVKDKIDLTLACAGLDWDVRTAVVKFNKNNEEYRIHIEDYTSMYGTETDYMAGINRLNADIVSGKVPDILLINSNMPVDSYISKGLFEDLKPYIEADAEIDFNNLMPNIIQAYSVEEKLYQLVPSYIVRTLVAKTSDVGSERGWTIEEALKVLNSKPEGCELITNTTRGDVLNNSIAMGNQFIDWKTGECKFDSEEFIQLLEFANMFPENRDNEIYNEDYWMNYDAMWREGKVICQEAYLYDFRNYNGTAKGIFGEPITMIGYPSTAGKGACLIADLQLAMSSKSQNKEGAYAFLRYFISDEYQDEMTYSFPISVKRFNAMAEEAMKVRTYTDENGNVVESPEYYYINDSEFEITPMSKEEAEQLKQDISSVTEVFYYNENLKQIIEEETAAYFAGQKDAREVATIIQSRAQIFVNENR